MPTVQSTPRLRVSIVPMRVRENTPAEIVYCIKDGMYEYLQYMKDPKPGDVVFTNDPDFALTNNSAGELAKIAEKLGFDVINPPAA